MGGREPLALHLVLAEGEYQNQISNIHIYMLLNLQHATIATSQVGARPLYVTSLRCALQIIYSEWLLLLPWLQFQSLGNGMNIIVYAMNARVDEINKCCHHCTRPSLRGTFCKQPPRCTINPVQRRNKVYSVHAQVAGAAA